MLGPEALKELARKLGSFKAKEAPLSYYLNNIDYDEYPVVRAKENEPCHNTIKAPLVKSVEKSRDKKRSSSITQFK